MLKVKIYVMPEPNLLDFIKNALAKGFSEDYIKNGLLSKGWPSDKINTAISIAKSRLSSKPKIKEEIPQIAQQRIKEKTHISIKSISIITLSFLGIFLLLSFTLIVYFYMNGIMNYTVIDQTTNTQYKKSCIYQDCHDLRDAALLAAKSKFSLSIIVSIVSTSLIILIYRLIPYKSIFFWSLNLVYFIFLTIMGIIWIKFSSS